MDFSKIIFKQDQMGEWKSTTHFQNGYSMSVIAGVMAYCNPRENLDDPQSYNTYEIAIFDEDGDWVTRRFTDEDDDVCGWLTKAEINDLMKKVAAYEWDEDHAHDQVMNKMIQGLEEDGEEV